jgi:hypothetical protein
MDKVLDIDLKSLLEILANEILKYMFIVVWVYFLRNTLIIRFIRKDFRILRGEAPGDGHTYKTDWGIILLTALLFDIGATIFFTLV